MGVFSVERLVHFRCGDCSRWWAVGDAPDRPYWYCPWCGLAQTFTETLVTQEQPMEGESGMGQAKDAMAEAQRNLVNGPPPGSRWRHFKGGVYRVLDNVILEEDLAPLVIYQSEKTGNKVARRLSQFLDVHPAHNVKRFEQIS